MVHSKASPVHRKTCSHHFQFCGVCQKAIRFPSDLESLFFVRWIVWMIEVDVEEDQGSPIEEAWQ